MAEGAVVPFPLSPSTAECRLLLTALLTPLLPESAETDTEENAADDAAREFTLSTLVYVSEELVPSADTEEWPLLTWLLREERVAEGSSGARLDRVELWGVTEGGKRDNGAEGRATLVLPPKDGDSGFGVEELDVESRAAEVLTPLKPFVTGPEDSLLWEKVSLE